MPRKKKVDTLANGHDVAVLLPLEATLSEIRVLLEARKQEFQTSADRIADIITTLEPKPRIGRPPKAQQA